MAPRRSAPPGGIAGGAPPKVKPDKSKAGKMSGSTDDDPTGAESDAERADRLEGENKALEANASETAKKLAEALKAKADAEAKLAAAGKGSSDPDAAKKLAEMTAKVADLEAKLAAKSGECATLTANLATADAKAKAGEELLKHELGKLAKRTGDEVDGMMPDALEAEFVKEGGKLEELAGKTIMVRVETMRNVVRGSRAKAKASESPKDSKDVPKPGGKTDELTLVDVPDASGEAPKEAKPEPRKGGFLKLPSLFGGRSS